MSKRKTNTNKDELSDKEGQAIQSLISTRNEMVKALKKVLDQMNKRNDNASENIRK